MARKQYQEFGDLPALEPEPVEEPTLEVLDQYKVIGGDDCIFLLETGTYLKNGEIVSLSSAQAEKLLADGLVKRAGADPQPNEEV